jgi:hypothetical protein
VTITWASEKWSPWGVAILVTANLTEELVDLFAAPIHPLSISPGNVFGYSSAEVFDDLEKTACMWIVRDK